MISTILYDFDNTLVDLSYAHFSVLNESLKEVCGYEIPYEEHVSIYNGLSTVDKLNILIDKQIVNRKDIEQINRIKQEKTIEYINANLKTDWGKVFLHQRIYEMGIKIGCVSNSVRATTHLGLEKTGQREFMSKVISNEDVVSKKPSAYPYQYAMESYQRNYDPLNFLAVEDSDKGIQSATDAGLHVFIVQNPTQVNYSSIQQSLAYIERIVNPFARQIFTYEQLQKNLRQS